MDWIIANFEWIFGGIGVFLLSLFIRNRSKSIKQSQRGGANSTNIQSAKSITINKDKNDQR